MASIGGGARKKEPTPRRSSSRGRMVDYKKMHEGSYGEAFKSESESGEHLTETIPPGASLGSAVLPEVEVTLDDYEAAFSQQDHRSLTLICFLYLYFPLRSRGKDGHFADAQIVSG